MYVQRTILSLHTGSIQFPTNRYSRSLRYAASRCADLANTRIWIVSNNFWESWIYLNFHWLLLFFWDTWILLRVCTDILNLYQSHNARFSWCTFFRNQKLLNLRPCCVTTEDKCIKQIITIKIRFLVIAKAYLSANYSPNISDIFDLSLFNECINCWNVCYKHWIYNSFMS